MTWSDLGPVGSCEQHGPHLPLETDTIVARALADDLARRRADCVVSPPLTITASGEHRGFPGTLSIGTEVMAGVIIELARSADWASGVVFVNGHGGNVTAMQRATEVFERERRNALVWWPRLGDGDPHAGHTETSLLLSLAPHLVRAERAVRGPIPEPADLIRHGVMPLSASGVLGDPTTATAEVGARLFAELADQLAASVADWAGP